eukprot:SAG11_NODE_2608_length_3175_cov_1.390442_4_plen_59_part_00
MHTVRDAIPPMSRELALHALAMGVRELNKWGLTGVHDAGVPPESIDLYRQSVLDGNFT